MELRHLRYFVAIAEERSFTRAAERLWVAQPALSAQIGRLETELGIKLFERHNRGADLTDAGEILLERARATLAAADAASAVGRDLKSGCVGALRLGVSSGVRWRRTAALLTHFARERDRIELTVLEGYAGTLWRELRDGRLDGLVCPAGMASPDLRTLQLGAERWLALVGTRHRLAGPGPLDVRALDGERICVTAHRDGAAYDRSVAEVLAGSGVTAELVPAVPGPAQYTSVAEGDAVALVTALESPRDGLVVRPLEPARWLAFELLWRDETPSPALEAFIALAARSQSSRASLVAVA